MFSAHTISHGETPSKATKRVRLFVGGVLDLQTPLWLFMNHGGFVEFGNEFSSVHQYRSSEQGHTPTGHMYYLTVLYALKILSAQHSCLSTRMLRKQ